MRAYLINRILQSILTFFLFLGVAFFLIDAAPGDFGDTFINNPKLTAEQRERIKTSLGLNKPVHERFLIWLGVGKWLGDLGVEGYKDTAGLLQGELGISFSNYPRKVLDVIAERAPRTITLFATATIVSFYLGFLAGKILAWRRGGLLEYTATIGGVGLFTVFLPWFALMMIWFWAYTLGLFPTGKFITVALWTESPVEANFIFNRLLITAVVASVAILIWLLVTRRAIPILRARMEWIGVGAIMLATVGYWLLIGIVDCSSLSGLAASISSPLCIPEAATVLPLGELARFAGDMLWHLILPVATLAAVSFAGTMLLTRNSMLETLREDYIQTAQAKGLPERVVRDHHAARNALLPVVTSFVFSLAAAIDGGIITEAIYSWPGMGQTLLQAALVEDIPMVIGGLVFTGALVLTAHLVADIMYVYLDPRIRYA